MQGASFFPEAVKKNIIAEFGDLRLPYQSAETRKCLQTTSNETQRVRSRSRCLVPLDQENL